MIVLRRIPLIEFKSAPAPGKYDWGPRYMFGGPIRITLHQPQPLGPLAGGPGPPVPPTGADAGLNIVSLQDGSLKV
jgi:hypothetical protein